MSRKKEKAQPDLDQPGYQQIRQFAGLESPIDYWELASPYLCLATGAPHLAADSPSLPLIMGPVDSHLTEMARDTVTGGAACTIRQRTTA